MSGFWRLCIGISDRDVLPSGEKGVWPDGRVPQIHFGREVLIYAFCGTLAAKLLMNR